MKHTQNLSHYGLLYILRECSSNVCVWRANPCVLHNFIGVKDVATIQYMNKLANIRYIHTCSSKGIIPLWYDAYK